MESGAGADFVGLIGVGVGDNGVALDGVNGFTESNFAAVLGYFFCEAL